MFRLVTSGCIILVIAGALWLLWLQPSSERDGFDSLLPPELADEPDVLIQGAFIRQFELSGNLKYTLQATEIRHFDRDTLTNLRKPELVLFDPAEPPWNVSAKRGHITEGKLSGVAQEKVQLIDDVVLLQRQADNGFIEIHTPGLTIYPDSQYAESSLDVMIDTNIGRTKAVGLTGDLATGVIKLGSNAKQRVHTIILPQTMSSRRSS